MNLHEYQAKQLFQEYDIPVPVGQPVYSVNEALGYVSEIGGNQWVVKAQVHAGGRRKAGGIQVVFSLEQVKDCVKEMLGSRLGTKQSGPRGQPVNCVLIEKLADIKKELYLAILIDRNLKRISILASNQGGINVEEVIENNLEQRILLPIDLITGLQQHQMNRLGFFLGLDLRARQQLCSILKGLYRLFIERDLSLVEINPLVLTSEGLLLALDAKIVADDNALYRQANLREWQDPTQEDEKEIVAKRLNLNYVTLSGDIACMVNGAGLAMATMDIIKLHGGEPANFLDVGGGVTADRVAEAFKLIVADVKVRAILVNIFGGIVRCDLIAKGLVQAFVDVKVNVPVIVRLSGTNVAEGRKILTDSGLKMIIAANFDAAADKVMAALKQNRI